MRLLLVLVLSSILLTPLAAAKTASPPVLTAGDHWEMRSAIPGFGNSTSFTTVEAREALVLNGTSHDAYRLVTKMEGSTSMSGFTIATATNTTTWTRVSDGATLKTTTRTTTTSTTPGFPTQDQTSETTYAEPCASFQWPLDAGKTWTARCTSTTTTNAGSTTQTTTTTSKVLREERVTVPAGAFDSFVIEISSDQDAGNATATTWYAPAACTSVKTTAGGEAAGMYSGELLSFACAKAGQSAGTTTGTTTTTTTTPAPGATTPVGAGTTPTPAANSTPGPGLALVLAAAAVVALLARKRS